MESLKLRAETGNLNQALAFVDEKLEERACPMKVQMQIDIAVEELFVNVASYAYPESGGDVEIRVRFFSGENSAEPKEDGIEITFIDGGVPYDPLAKPDPDITLGAEERQMGGLGIYMVKKSMDAVFYRYEADKNVLTIQKKFG